MPTLAAAPARVRIDPLTGWPYPSACDTAVSHADLPLDPSERTTWTAPDPEPAARAADRQGTGEDPDRAAVAIATDRLPGLDPDVELTGHPLELQSRFQGILHAKVQHRRRLIIDALFSASGDPVLQRRARQLGWCCGTPSIRIGAKGPAPSLARCRDRMCPLCAKLRGSQAARRTAALVRKFSSPRFITLTLRHTQAPLSEQLDRLAECVRTLRGSKMWRARVAGGVNATEVTFNTKRTEWHPHGHLIVTGKYIPWAQLKAEWLRVTGDSDVVRIQMVHDRDQAANYIARYVGKPVDAESWPPERIREYALAMKGRRLLQPFGSAMKAEVDDDEDESLAPGTEHLCDARKLCDAADTGHPAAQRACEILARTGAAMAAIMLRPLAEGDSPLPPTAAELEYAVQVARVTQAEPAESLYCAYDALPPPPVAGEPPCEPAESPEAPSSASG